MISRVGRLAAGVLGVVVLAAGVLCAQSREEVVLWKTIENSTHVSDFEAYIAQHPDGVYVALAKARIVAMRKAEAEQEARTQEEHRTAEASRVHSFTVRHGHPGLRNFPPNNTGTLTLQPGKLTFSEPSHPDDGFAVDCSQVLKLGKFNPGIGGGWAGLDLKLSQRTYKFAVSELELPKLHRAFETDACP